MSYSAIYTQLPVFTLCIEIFHFEIEQAGLLLTTIAAFSTTDPPFDIVPIYTSSSVHAVLFLPRAIIRWPRRQFRNRVFEMCVCRSNSSFYVDAVAEL